MGGHYIMCLDYNRCDGWSSWCLCVCVFRNSEKCGYVRFRLNCATNWKRGLSTPHTHPPSFYTSQKMLCGRVKAIRLIYVACIHKMTPVLRIFPVTPMFDIGKSQMSLASYNTRTRTNHSLCLRFQYFIQTSNQRHTHAIPGYIAL